MGTTIGKSWLWYDVKQLEQLAPIDMLLIDGPPMATQRLARYRCKNTELSEHYALLRRCFLNPEVESTAIIVFGREVRKAIEKDQPA